MLQKLFAINHCVTVGTLSCGHRTVKGVDDPDLTKRALADSSPKGISEPRARAPGERTTRLPRRAAQSARAETKAKRLALLARLCGLPFARPDIVDPVSKRSPGSPQLRLVRLPIGRSKARVLHGALFHSGTCSAIRNCGRETGYAHLGAPALRWSLRVHRRANAWQRGHQ